MALLCCQTTDIPCGPAMQWCPGRNRPETPGDHRDIIADPHGRSFAFMSIAIVVFGLGCWLHYSPVNRSLASRLHVARIPRIDSLTSSIEAEWFQIEFEFDSDGNSQPLYVYIDRVKRQRFFASLNLIKKTRIHSFLDLVSDFFGKFLAMFQCTRKRKSYNCLTRVARWLGSKSP